MKITKLSLVAIAAMTLTTGAMADVDFKIGGQTVIYYQTAENGGNTGLFEKGNSAANVGIQLNANADLGNGFGLGLQGTSLGTLGLEKNVVSDVMQHASSDLNGAAITKAYLTKQLGNTTLKAGRQELPKSLSPLAFSEGWNVFKNTFDAVVAINSDLPKTTLVGAYVANSNQHGNLGTFGNLTAHAGGARPDSGAYMLTAQNKSLDNVAVTGSYYSIIKSNTSAAPHVDALWLDVKAAQVGPVAVALQAGQLSPDVSTLKDTNVYGAKVSGKASNVNLSLAYSSVNDGTLEVKNVGTGVKTPLYTQMVANQDHISTDADTFVLGASMPLAAGTLIAKYDITKDNAASNSDYNELDVIYKFKALGTDVLAAYVRADHDGANTANIIRLWSRYNF